MFMTQLESAVAGVVTKEMKVVAEKERMDEDVLRSLVASGKVVIPCNKQHTSISPEGIGKRLRTKVNVNLGTSKDVTDYDSEIEKVNRAIRLGAEAIMDLSTHGDTRIKYQRASYAGMIPIRYKGQVLAALSQPI